MDLISRKEVVSQIEFWLTDSTDYKSALEDTLERVKNTRSAFDGMTNGEVIQAMFPNFKTETISFNGIRLYIDDEAHTKIADFTHRWWNAPYKGVRE